jgi:thymidylate kinase
VFKIPKPDVVFYLSLPMRIVTELIEKRNAENRATGNARAYLGKKGNKQDVHEADFEFLANSQKSALWLAEREKNWKKIECSTAGEILPRETIHEQMYVSVAKMLGAKKMPAKKSKSKTKTKASK